ncbi:unnamed protein product [Adineta ricciae]|uniref:AB hydrolase-1 domain-containing protein n=1 Tax=Adineta ricciae TaxID=249248 RepID=A0A814IPC7_ADIRI|nr:unnamed protein product [Adineta ricciae]
MPYVTLPVSHQNVTLYYEVHGSGPIKILFIMGLWTEGRSWKYQTDYFSTQSYYQCVTYDNRGCGRSSAPKTLEYTTTQMAKDALTLIEHLHWNQCHVVGFSLGGMIAQELALLAPRKILSLTLIATHAGGLISRPPFAALRFFLQWFLIRNKDQLVKNMLRVFYGKKTLNDPEKRQATVQRHYISYSELLKLRYSNIPCTIMVGAEDQIIHKVNSYMLQTILGCKLVKFELAGHDLISEHAQEINRELLELCESNFAKNYSSHMPMKYEVEVQTLKLCCQHRIHCFTYSCIGFSKGLLIGLILYFGLIQNLTVSEQMNAKLFTHCVMFIGCLSGLHRTVSCIFNAFQARRFAQRHQVFLGPAASSHIKNALLNECGLEFPTLSIICFTSFLSLLWWTKLYA